MKLINNTKIPDLVLLDVLKNAALSLHKQIRTSGVVVYVGNSSRSYSAGVAYNADKVRWDKRWRLTDKGAFKIMLPSVHYTSIIPDFITLAKRFFETAQHEWGHIYDFQYEARKKVKLEWAQRVNGRRMKHEYRPEEKRVYEYL